MALRKQDEIYTHFLIGALAGTLGQVDVGLLQDDVGVTTAHTLDGGHGEHNLALAIDVRTHDTQDVLELLGKGERLAKTQTNTHIVSPGCFGG